MQRMNNGILNTDNVYLVAARVQPARTDADADDVYCVLLMSSIIVYKLDTILSYFTDTRRGTGGEEARRCLLLELTLGRHVDITVRQLSVRC